MAGDDPEKPEPSLELPKLFGRKKKAAPVEPEAEPQVEAEAVAPAPAPVKASAPEPARAAPAAPPAQEAPTEVIPPPPPATPVAAPAARVDEPPPATPVEEATPLFTDEVPAATATLAPVERQVEQERAPRQFPRPRLSRPRISLPSRGSLPLPALPAVPRPTGYAAVAVTGLVVGLVLVGLTGGALQACDAVRGTSTCGGDVGFPLLVLILAGTVVLGAVLLRLLEVPEPSSTSFMGVGLVAVVGLLFLVDVLLSWWMLLVIPVVSVGTYLLASWVTTSFVEPAKD